MGALRNIVISAFVAAVILLVHGGAAVAAVAVPAAADFAKKSKFLTAKISPSGERIAVTFWKDGAIALGVIDLKSTKIIGSVWFTRGQHVASYAWVSDQRLIFGLGKSDGMLDQIVPTGELYAMDADGSHKAYLFGYRGGMSTGTHIQRVTTEYGYAAIVDPMPKDPDHALILVNFWDPQNGKFQAGVYLYQIDVRTGQKRRVGYLQGTQASGSGLVSTGVVTDTEGQPRYAVAVREDGSFAEMKRQPPENEWVVAKIHDRHTSLRLLGVSDDLTRVYMVSDEGSERECVRARDLSTDELSTLSCNDLVDPSSVFMSVDGRPVAVDYEPGWPQTELLDADSADGKTYRLLQKAFSGQRIRITSRTQDGRKLIVMVDSDRNPGDFYLFDRETKRADYLFSHSEWVNPESMHNVLPIDFKARDGLFLHGYITSPSGLKPDKRPLVLLVHGGPHQDRDRWEWQAWPQYLASLGYSVMQVNYRGSEGYGGTFEAAGYRKWGSVMQDDLTDAVRWAIDLRIADASRVCIMGASYGGYAAVMSATREPTLYRCAITFAGPMDLVTQSKDSDTSETGFGRMYLKDVLGDDNETLQKNSPITYVDKLQVPVLIAHGTADERVPFSQSEELRDALDRLKKPYEWLPFKGEEHGFYLEANEEKFLLAVKDFLEKNIGPAIANAPVPGTGGD